MQGRAGERQLRCWDEARRKKIGIIDGPGESRAQPYRVLPAASIENPKYEN
jgi:hypothetical protein